MCMINMKSNINAGYNDSQKSNQIKWTDSLRMTTNQYDNIVFVCAKAAKLAN